MAATEGKKYVVRHSGLATGHREGQIVTEGDFRTPAELGWPGTHQSIFDRYVEIGAISPATEAEIEAAEREQSVLEQAERQFGTPPEAVSATAFDELRAEIKARADFWENRVADLEQQIKDLQEQREQAEDSRSDYDRAMEAQMAAAKEKAPKK